MKRITKNMAINIAIQFLNNCEIDEAKQVLENYKTLRIDDNQVVALDESYLNEGYVLPIGNFLKETE